MGRFGKARSVPLVETLQADSKELWRPSHFVERNQAVVDIECRVLQPLRHNRARALLKLQDKIQLQPPGLVGEMIKFFQKQHVAEEIKNRNVDGRVPSFDRPEGSEDNLTIGLC